MTVFILRPEIAAMRLALARCELILAAEKMGFKFEIELPEGSTIPLLDRVAENADAQKENENPDH